MKNILTTIVFCTALSILVSCHNNGPKNEAKTLPVTITYKGLYSFGPEVKSFKDCKSGQEFWAADSSAKLELAYSQLHFEKPYEPVYVEVEGKKIKSGNDGAAAEFDSTMIVTKVVKITKDIPADKCNFTEPKQESAKATK